MRKNIHNLLIFAAIGCIALAGCKSPQGHRESADRVAQGYIAAAQKKAFGRTEPFTIDQSADTLRRRLMLDQHLPHASEASLSTRDIKPIPQWPKDNYLQREPAQKPLAIAVPTTQPLRLSLLDALQVGAASSRDYQTQKETVFRSALALDLEENEFRNIWGGLIEGLLQSDLRGDKAVNGASISAGPEFSRQLKSGAKITSLLAWDLAKLLSNGRSESMGLVAEGSISIPLLRGSSRFVVTEPLTQAQRNTIYAIHDFERFKRTFAVRVATDYLGVLQQLDQFNNAEASYRRLVSSTRRARRNADAGRLPEIQVDQARQDELRARNRWISSREAYANALDQFKILLGLPTDAAIDLDPAELGKLVAAAAPMMAPRSGEDSSIESVPADAPVVIKEPDRKDVGPYELDETVAIGLALEHRLDLRNAIGRVFDAQRLVAVAADDLRADLTLLGSASAGSSRSIGSATADNAKLRPEHGLYSALLSLNLPIERTAERDAYRGELIDLERAVRSAQESEDKVKQDVRSDLRSLLESRESLRIQAESVRVAQRRVASTDLFLEAGRAAIRDVLEAQEALLSAQNALTSAVVRYRIAELAMQRDMDLLEVNEQGLWREFDPANIPPKDVSHGNI